MQVTYLKTIILCSVYSIWFVKYMFSAKIWSMKTSTRIVKYESWVVKSNTDVLVIFETNDLKEVHFFISIIRVQCKFQNKIIPKSFKIKFQNEELVYHTCCVFSTTNFWCFTFFFMFLKNSKPLWNHVFSNTFFLFFVFK